MAVGGWMVVVMVLLLLPLTTRHRRLPSGRRGPCPSSSWCHPSAGSATLNGRAGFCRTGRRQRYLWLNLRSQTMLTGVTCFKRFTVIPIVNIIAWTEWILLDCRSLIPMLGLLGLVAIVRNIIIGEVTVQLLRVNVRHWSSDGSNLIGLNVRDHIAANDALTLGRIVWRADDHLRIVTRLNNALPGILIKKC